MDPVTGQINKQLPLVFSLLYTNYGQITPTALNQKHDACTNLVYNPSKPIDQIWVQITGYSLMAQAEKSPATSEQLINIGIIFLQRAGVFTNNIRECLNRPTQEQNWPTFQEHFSKSQLELELAQPTANCMGFHNQSANSADEILNKLYDKISSDTTAPATYYKNSKATAATQMNQHMQQLTQSTQQNTHMQNVLQNFTSQVTNLQNQLNNAPQPTQKHPRYQHQAYPAFTPAPAPYQQPTPAPYQQSPPPSPLATQKPGSLSP